MKIIEGRLNQELLDIIDPFAEWFFEQDRSLIKLDGESDEKEYYNSAEYLEKRLQEDIHRTGFPEITYGMDLSRVDATPVAWRDRINNLDNDLNVFLGAKFNAVKMYYPAGGYMGWHNNGNCHGYNILLSYTKTGNGYFRFRDNATGNLVDLQDKPGWMAKVGYFGSYEEDDLIYWHTARAYEERLTLGYVIPNLEFWEMMVEDLTE